jgi:hypothetical protein
MAAAKRELDQAQSRKLQEESSSSSEESPKYIISEVADPPENPSARFVEIYTEFPPFERTGDNLESFYLARSRSDMEGQDVVESYTHAVAFSSLNLAPDSNFILVCADSEAFAAAYPCQTCDIENKAFFEDFSGDVRVTIQDRATGGRLGSILDKYGGLEGSVEGRGFEAAVGAIAFVETANLKVEESSEVEDSYVVGYVEGALVAFNDAEYEDDDGYIEGQAYLTAGSSVAKGPQGQVLSGSGAELNAETFAETDDASVGARIEGENGAASVPAGFGEFEESTYAKGELEGEAGGYSNDGLVGVFSRVQGESNTSSPKDATSLSTAATGTKLKEEYELYGGETQLYESAEAEADVTPDTDESSAFDTYYYYFDQVKGSASAFAGASADSENLAASGSQSATAEVISGVGGREGASPRRRPLREAASARAEKNRAV